MSVRKLNKKTKDGRSWVFEYRYKNYEGNIKKYTSRRYHTKTQAKEGEMIFIMERKEIKERKIMTFKELYELFFIYQRSRVKNTTLYNYSQKIKYFKNIENVKLHEITTSTYNYWRNSLNQTKLGDSYKNDILKFFKELLKFAEKMYDYDFRKLYNKFDKFRNPNEIIDKCFDYYTFQEYTKFIEQEKELKYIIAFDLLYYCGLRRGELLGLTWEYIDLNKKELHVRNNLVEDRFEGGYKISTPKTKDSARTIPLTEFLTENLKNLKEEAKKNKNFNNKWFVVGNEKYLSSTTLYSRKNKNCKLADLKQIRIHDFRHSCASLLISSHANVTIVAKYLGHSDIEETLNTYAHFFKSDMDQIINVLNELK